MASRLELQPLVTVNGDTTSGDVTIIQPIDLWASIGNWGAAIFTTAVSHVSVISGDTVDVMLMTCPNKFGYQAPAPSGPSSQIAAFSLNLVSAPQWYKTITMLEQTSTITNPTNGPIEDWVFWSIKVNQGVTAGPFSITFDISATLKWAV